MMGWPGFGGTRVGKQDVKNRVVHLVRNSRTKCGILTTDLVDSSETEHRYVVEFDWDEGALTCPACKKAKRS